MDKIAIFSERKTMLNGDLSLRGRLQKKIECIMVNWSGV